MSEHEARDDKSRSDDYYEHCKFDQRIINSNMKRTYDEYQDLALTAARRSQDHYDELKNLSVQFMQDAVADIGSARKKQIINIFTSKDELEDVMYSSVSRDEGLVDAVVAKVLAEMAKNK
jgi:hypothetical protein